MVACAALYGGNGAQQCQFDNNGKITDASRESCGLSSLLAFVQAVDTVKIQEGCATALTNYLNTTCTPEPSSSFKYPWNCRNFSLKNIQDQLVRQANLYCKDPSLSDTWSTINDVNDDIKTTIASLLRTISAELYTAQENVCDSYNGLWIEPAFWTSTFSLESAYYQVATGGVKPTDMDQAKSAAASLDTEFYVTDYPTGYCIENTVMYQCQAQDDATGNAGYATFDNMTNTCKLTTEWYQLQCTSIGGYFENQVCYIPPEKTTTPDEPAK